MNATTVSEIGTAVAAPAYDRGRVDVGIVHIGVGGFHRAHQAMYVDRLLNAGDASEWGICGVGVLPADAAMREALDAQDGLYTLLAKHPDGTIEPRVIGSIVRYLHAPDDPLAVIGVMADPRTRIVSLTITEGGYNVDPVTGAFDLEQPAVAEDLRNGTPSTVFGFVVEALRRRRAAGTQPFTVMSCDNLPGNGDVARRAFAAFADATDTDLGAWIRTAVAFPSSMVDRITPTTTDADRTLLRDRYGIADRWPVVCEDFVQWVLEDDFPCGRPRWEDAGVQLVDDVEPYELMKLRLLNAGHQALAYVGYLSGYRLVHEAAADPLIREFVGGYMRDEGVPTVPDVPGTDLDLYCRTLLARFANPGVRDTVARLCADSSDRIPKWLVPVIRDNLATGGEVRRAAAVVASWARYAEGVDEHGQPMDVVDRRHDEVTSRARRWDTEPLAFIDNRVLFGDLVDHERFTTAYRWALTSFHTVGVRRTLAALDTALRPLSPLSRDA